MPFSINDPVSILKPAVTRRHQKGTFTENPELRGKLHREIITHGVARSASLELFELKKAYSCEDAGGTTGFYRGEIARKVNSFKRGENERMTTVIDFE